MESEVGSQRTEDGGQRGEKAVTSMEYGVLRRESLGRLGDSEIGRIEETEDVGQRTEVSERKKKFGRSEMKKICKWNERRIFL